MKPKNIKNYHKASVKVEDQYSEELLVLFGSLLLKLNEVKNLNKTNIDQIVTYWKIENNRQIQDINTIFVEKAEHIANQQLPPRSDYQNQQKVDKLSIANDQMLNITTEYIRQKFIELSVLEHNYHYTTDLSTQFLHSISKSTEDKIVLFTTMATIQNVREFLFGNAKSYGYTEYMWETQRDSRVRPAHVAMDRKWVLIDEAPAETGYHHVGQDYNCRCYAKKFR